MSAIPREWVAEADRIITRTGYQPIEKMAQAVVEGLAPLIREAIATEIEEKADDYGWDETLDAWATNDIDAIRDLVKTEIHACAAIARGGAL